MKNKDFVIGMILAFAAEGAATVQKTPTGYSYNGVVLPALPEWDREGYPFAFIQIHKTVLGTVGYIHLYCCTTPTTTVIGGADYLTAENGIYCVGTDGTWGEYKEAGEGTAYGQVAAPIKEIQWASFDIYDSEDTVYLAASEPVPVYE